MTHHFVIKGVTKGLKVIERVFSEVIFSLEMG
jgi:hypothetical protein